MKRFFAVGVTSLILFFGFTSFRCSNHIAIGTGHHTRLIYLPDSSIAILNHHSAITYDSCRNVTGVIGEAFFKIRPGEKPFTVTVGKATISCSSSADFNVNAYRLADTSLIADMPFLVQGIRITAYKGNVNVNDKKADYQIEREMSVIVGREESFKCYASTSENDSTWTTGTYCFSGGSFGELADFASVFFHTSLELKPGGEYYMRRPLLVKVDMPFSTMIDSLEAVLNCKVEKTSFDSYTVKLMDK